MLTMPFVSDKSLATLSGYLLDLYTRRGKNGHVASTQHIWPDKGLEKKTMSVFDDIAGAETKQGKRYPFIDCAGKFMLEVRELDHFVSGKQSKTPGHDQLKHVFRVVSSDNESLPEGLEVCEIHNITLHEFLKGHAKSMIAAAYGVDSSKLDGKDVTDAYNIEAAPLSGRYVYCTSEEDTTQRGTKIHRKTWFPYPEDKQAVSQADVIGKVKALRK